MKRLLSLAILGIFTAAIAGCHASADVDPDRADHIDRTSSGYSKKTTTVREPDGDTSTKTEVKRY